MPSTERQREICRRRHRRVKALKRRTKLQIAEGRKAKRKAAPKTPSKPAAPSKPATPSGSDAGADSKS